MSNIGYHVPNNKDWENACANIKHLHKLRAATLEDLQMKDPNGRTGRPPTDISIQSEAFRAHVRGKGYIEEPELCCEWGEVGQ